MALPLTEMLPSEYVASILFRDTNGLLTSPESNINPDTRTMFCSIAAEYDEVWKSVTADVTSRLTDADDLLDALTSIPTDGSQSIFHCCKNGCVTPFYGADQSTDLIALGNSISSSVTLTMMESNASVASARRPLLRWLSKDVRRVAMKAYTTVFEAASASQECRRDLYYLLVKWLEERLLQQFASIAQAAAELDCTPCCTPSSNLADLPEIDRQTFLHTNGYVPGTLSQRVWRAVDTNDPAAQQVYSAEKAVFVQLQQVYYAFRIMMVWGADVFAPLAADDELAAVSARRQSELIDSLQYPNCKLCVEPQDAIELNRDPSKDWRERIVHNLHLDVLEGVMMHHVTLQQRLVAIYSRWSDQERRTRRNWSAASPGVPRNATCCRSGGCESSTSSDPMACSHSSYEEALSSATSLEGASGSTPVLDVSGQSEVAPKTSIECPCVTHSHRHNFAGPKSLIIIWVSLGSRNRGHYLQSNGIMFDKNCAKPYSQYLRAHYAETFSSDCTTWPLERRRGYCTWVRDTLRGEAGLIRHLFPCKCEIMILQVFRIPLLRPHYKALLTDKDVGIAARLSDGAVRDAIECYRIAVDDGYRAREHACPDAVDVTADQVAQFVGACTQQVLLCAETAIIEYLREGNLHLWRNIQAALLSAIEIVLGIYSISDEFITGAVSDRNHRTLFFAARDEAMRRVLSLYSGNIYTQLGISSPWGAACAHVPRMDTATKDMSLIHVAYNAYWGKLVTSTDSFLSGVVDRLTGKDVREGISAWIPANLQEKLVHNARRTLSGSTRPDSTDKARLRQRLPQTDEEVAKQQGFRLGRLVRNTVRRLSDVVAHLEDASVLDMFLLGFQHTLGQRLVCYLSELPENAEAVTHRLAVEVAAKAETQLNFGGLARNDVMLREVEAIASEKDDALSAAYHAFIAENGAGGLTIPAASSTLIVPPLEMPSMQKICCLSKWSWTAVYFDQVYDLSPVLSPLHRGALSTAMQTYQKKYNNKRSLELSWELSFASVALTFDRPAEEDHTSSAASGSMLELRCSMTQAVILSVMVSNQNIESREAERHRARGTTVEQLFSHFGGNVARSILRTHLVVFLREGLAYTEGHLYRNEPPLDLLTQIPDDVSCLVVDPRLPGRRGDHLDNWNEQIPDLFMRVGNVDTFVQFGIPMPRDGSAFAVRDQTKTPPPPKTTTDAVPESTKTYFVDACLMRIVKRHSPIRFDTLCRLVVDEIRSFQAQNTVTVNSAPLWFITRRLQSLITREFIAVKQHTPSTNDKSGPTSDSSSTASRGTTFSESTVFVYVP